MRRNTARDDYELFLLRIASGKHPLTGERLPENSPWKDQEIILAVQDVLGTNNQDSSKTSGQVAASDLTDHADLQKEKTKKNNLRLERIRAKHPNAYRSWTQEEEAQLVSLWNAGADIDELASTMGRGAGGIQSRLEKLGYEVVPSDEQEVPEAASDEQDSDLIEELEQETSEIEERCAECDEVIPAARLAAVPGTKHCTNCAASFGFEKKQVSESWGTREDYKKDRKSWMPWRRN